MAGNYNDGYTAGRYGGYGSYCPEGASDAQKAGFRQGESERKALEAWEAQRQHDLWAKNKSDEPTPYYGGDSSFSSYISTHSYIPDSAQTPRAKALADAFKADAARPLTPRAVGMLGIAALLVAAGAWFGAGIKHQLDRPDYVPTGRTLKIFTALTTARHVIETRWARSMAAVHGIEDKLSGKTAKNRDYTIEQDAKLASRASVGLLVKTLDRREWPLLQFVHDRDPHENGPVKELLPKIHSLDADYAQFVGENAALLMAAPGSSQAAGHAWEIARDKFEKEHEARVTLNRAYVDQPMVSRLSPADSDHTTATNSR